MSCPKCGFARPSGAIDCARCGIVFSKWSAPAADDGHPAAGIWAPPPPPPSVVHHSLAEDGAFGPYEQRILVIGLVAAIVAQLIPISRWGLAALKTLFHEIGHAVVAWPLGQPAIPAFDFTYGGGFTHLTDFQPIVALLVFAGFLWSIWRLRTNRRSVVILLSLTVVWLIAVSAEWRRETIIASAGVLFELILAAVFFYMALSGHGWRRPRVERPLGAFVAFFVLMSTMIFSWRLGHDPDFMSWYLEGKGGALMNDLEIVALNLHIYTPLNPGVTGLANIILFLAPVPFVAAFVIHRKRSHVQRLARELLTV